MSNAFSSHLREAIHLNRARRAQYAAMTGGRSAALSTALIALERLTLPLARWFELRAWRQPQRRHLLELSFVPMHVPASSLRPALREGPSRDQQRPARACLRRLGRSLHEPDLVQRCQDTLRALEILERQHGAHLAMSRHLVESIGRVAMVRARLGLEKDRFARDLLRLHALALPLAPWLDGRAQRLHQRGAGLLVNDLPAIPFA